jgi:hypothetical protein
VLVSDERNHVVITTNIHLIRKARRLEGNRKDAAGGSVILRGKQRRLFFGISSGHVSKTSSHFYHEETPTRPHGVRRLKS